MINIKKISIRSFILLPILMTVGCTIKSESTQTYQEYHFQKSGYVIDGDTFKTIINGQNESIRVLGINTPEISTTLDAGLKFANDAKEFTAVALQSPFTLEYIKRDKYGRIVGRIIFDDGHDLSNMLVENGFARVEYISHTKGNYFYFSDSSWINNLFSLQELAKKQGKGVWQYDENLIWD